MCRIRGMSGNGRASQTARNGATALAAIKSAAEWVRALELSQRTGTSP